jgi:hypothetical protein
VVGLLFGGFEVGVAFGVETAFVGGVEGVGTDDLCFFLVDVVELGLETQLLLHFL